MDVEYGVIVIDLGLERGEPPTYVERRAPKSPWLPASLLAVLVLLGVVASAPPPGPALRSLFSLRMGPGDAYEVTEDGQLLAQTYGVLGSYGLTDGRLRWQNGPSLPAFTLRTRSGVVLIQPYTGGATYSDTTAVDQHTGREIWHRAGRIVTVAGSDTLLAVNQVRTVSDTGRRVEGGVSAVDPGSGATLWTVPVPNTAVLLGIPGPGDGPGRMLLVRDDRTAQISDLVSGRELARTTLPGAAYDPDNPVVTSGAIVLMHDDSLTAYDPGTLRPLWTVSEPGSQEMQACGDLICVQVRNAGLFAIDPRTGARIWHRPDWGLLQRVGHAYVAYPADDQTRLLAVADPETGRTLVDLDGWNVIDGSPGGNDLLVARQSAVKDRTMVAVAHPGDATPDPLAVLPAGAGDCSAAPGRLICRSSYGELNVWAYGQKG